MNCNEVEKEGVGLVEEYLKRNGQKCRETKGKDEQIKGDLVVTDNHKNEVFLEVKTERKYTGNVFLEMVARTRANYCGWFLYCEADYVYYNFLDNDNAIYVINLSKLRKWFFDKGNVDHYKMKRQKVSDTDFAMGYIVPIKDLKKCKCLNVCYIDKLKQDKKSSIFSKWRKKHA